MMHGTKISPLKAVLICLNSMIGAGLFINTKPLTQLAGSWGFLGYIVAPIILFPLILCVAELAAKYPVAGGLYVYSKTYVGPWAGFISGWSYFIGKTTSISLLLHKFVQFFQVRITHLNNIPTLAIDIPLLLLLVILNINGLTVGGKIQYAFTMLKIIPIICIFFLGAVYCDISQFTDLLALQDLLYTVPIAIFPLLSFEVICSIGNMIEDGQQNIKRVILIAFGLVAGVNILFQMSSFMILGNELNTVNESMLAMLLKGVSNYPLIASVLNGAVFASIIGACFSILTSNCWNLYTIAYYNHLPGRSLLTKINKNNVPYVSLLCEFVIGVLILCITIDQVPLQNMSVLAQVISYITTAIAAWYAVRSKTLTNLSWWLPLLAIATCSFILGICIYRIVLFGTSLPFLIILGFGIFLAGSKSLLERAH